MHTAAKFNWECRMAKINDDVSTIAFMRHPGIPLPSLIFRQFHLSHNSPKCHFLHRCSAIIRVLAYILFDCIAVLAARSRINAICHYPISSVYILIIFGRIERWSRLRGRKRAAGGRIREIRAFRTYSAAFNRTILPCIDLSSLFLSTFLFLLLSRHLACIPNLLIANKFAVISHNQFSQGLPPQ